MPSWIIWNRIWVSRRDWLANPVVWRMVTTGVASNRPKIPPLRRVVPGALMLLALHAMVIMWGTGTWAEWFLTAAVLLLIVLLIFGPSLVLWIMPLGVALGPVIVRERTQFTWDLLRITPLDVDDLLLGKLTGALWWSRDALRSVETVAVVGGFLVAGITLVLHWDPASASVSSLTKFAVMLWILLGGVCFVLDRLQQMVLMSVAALAVSASVRSTRLGIVAGVVAAGAIWLAEIGLAVVIMLLQPGQLAISWVIPAAGLVAIGPTGGYLFELSVELLPLAVIGTLIIRESAIRGLWWWGRRAAQREM